MKLEMVEGSPMRYFLYFNIHLSLLFVFSHACKFSKELLKLNLSKHGATGLFKSDGEVSVSEGNCSSTVGSDTGCKFSVRFHDIGAVMNKSFTAHSPDKIKKKIEL